MVPCSVLNRGFARLSRRFDLPKGVVAYACELFCKEKPELMHKIRMCNSGKQAQALKEAMAKSKHPKPKTLTKGSSPSPSTVVKPLVNMAKLPSPPLSPSLSTKNRKPDPPTAKEEASTRDASSDKKSDVAVKRYLQVQAESNARIALLREQTARELDAQRMFLQQQQMQHHAQMRRASRYGQAAMPNNFLELALLQEALANRLTGPR